MHPLSYTAPVSKAEYLAGRFLAAYALNALILLAVPAGMLLGMHCRRRAEIVGPWRPAAFVAAYFLITLPNAFIATAVQFASRPCAAAPWSATSAAWCLSSHRWAWRRSSWCGATDLARLLDPVGMIAIVSGLSDTWTPHEVNTRLVGLQPMLLCNRLLWLGVGAAVLAFTYRRFRLAHPAEGGRRARRLRATRCARRRRPGRATASRRASHDRRRFSATFASRRTCANCSPSRGRHSRTLARGWTGFRRCGAGWCSAFFSPHGDCSMGVPLLPRTEHVLTY